MLKTPVLAALVLGIIIGFGARSLIGTGKKTGDTHRSTTGTVATRPVGDRSPAEGGQKLSALVPPSTSRAAETSPEGSTPKPTVSVIAADGVDLAEVAEAFEARKRARDEREIALKLAALTRRLGLSEEQQAEVRQLLLDRAARKRAAVGQVFNLGGGGASAARSVIESAFGSGDGDTPSLEDELAQILEGEQFAAFESYQMEQLANEAEVRAYRDLASLQSMFDLSPEQKDLAFRALVDLDPPEDGQAYGGFVRRELRKAALEPILTPEQFEIYEDSPTTSSLTISPSDSGATILGTAISLEAADPPAGPPPAPTGE